jgi:chitin synthase
MFNNFMYWLFFIFHKLHLLFDVRVAQKYEYTVAHILDKNFESLTGFLHVLPGAWSGYRTEALFQSKQFSENLIEKKYLKTVLNPDKEL